jgi:twitching motility protein PilU
MRTFDWALFELYNEGLISFDEALRNADSANELRLNIKLKSQRGEPEASAFMSLALETEPLTPEELEAQRIKELQEQAVTRKRLEDEAVRDRMRQGVAAAAGTGAAGGPAMPRR